MGASDHAVGKGLKMLRKSDGTVKKKNATSSEVKRVMKGVTYGPKQLNVHSFLECQFLPVYAMHMPCRDIRELNPLSRSHMYGWYKEWTEKTHVDKGLVGTVETFRKVWSSAWFKDVFMRKNQTVGKDCCGHDCGNKACPMRMGCTVEIQKLKANARTHQEREQVAKLEAEHLIFHGRDLQAYHMNKAHGADPGVKIGQFAPIHPSMHPSFPLCVCLFAHSFAGPLTWFIAVPQTPRLPVLAQMALIRMRCRLPAW